MNGPLVKTRDYFGLFVRREGRVVFGKGFVNLWLLTAVLFVTFIAIAFSNASLNYLSEKMNDPFTNWINIENDNKGENKYAELEKRLNEKELQDHYRFCGYTSDLKGGYMFCGKSTQMIKYLRVRFFERMNTALVAAILSADNVVNGCALDASVISDNSLGVIITAEAMKRLGYDDNFPAYISILSDNHGAEEFGFDIDESNMAPTPLPILAVVEKLPMNMDVIATRFLEEQKMNTRTYPFNLAKDYYARTMFYFVPQSESGFRDVLDTITKSVTDESFRIDERVDMQMMKSYAAGRILCLSFDNAAAVPYDVVQTIASHIAEQYGDKGVCRIFDYEVSDTDFNGRSAVSINFYELDSIRAFERFVLDNYDIKIEMSQVNTKENFHSVSLMANILSWSMIVFAIICIVLFIVNLLRSYFQRVKRNIGTFKAFGVSNNVLIGVYMLIVLLMIAFALVISLSASLLVQWLLGVFGFLKEGIYPFLALQSPKTLCAVLIIISISCCTVYIVMSKLLRATPGDLIYDRN